MNGETKCGCGCGRDILTSFRQTIIRIESAAGFQVNVLSGARCPKYNKTIPGSIAGDAHELMVAVDIEVNPDSPEGRRRIGALIAACYKIGIARFGDGMALHKSLHIDDARELPHPRWWFYK
jgi:hypothetical protein